MREIERKYEAIEGMELLDPAVVLGVDTATGPEEQVLEAVYFDTAGLCLFRCRGDVAASGGWIRRGLAPEAADG